jgi:hypothetical protein
MAKYEIVYAVELEVPEGTDPKMEAYYWHEKLLRNSEIELPEYVDWVRTAPLVREVA